MDRKKLETYMALSRSGIELEPSQTEEVLSVYDQLVKANERIVELDKKNNEYAICIIAICDRADVQDYLKNNPTYENARVQLHKFEVETRAKALQSLLDRKCPVSGYVMRDKESREIVAEELEQLLKDKNL